VRGRLSSFSLGAREPVSETDAWGLPGTSNCCPRARFTASLEAMADWLATEGVTEVVMEATGSYWKPVWYLLEDRGPEKIA
jgi:hypothetical protein